MNLFLRDAENTRFKSNFFDGVALINILFCVKDPKKVLRESFRILKHEGILVVTGPKTNPNIKVIKEAAANDYKKNGIIHTNKENINAAFVLGKELVQKGINNTYDSKELIEILINEIGFSKVIYYDDITYLEQNHFVVAQT